jgi:tRNA(adenine34) deaminase
MSFHLRLRERVIAAAHDQRKMLRDPAAHVEMIAITQVAGSIGA